MVEIIFSTVVAAVAIKAAQDVARYLGPSHFYVDLNSVSPATKQLIGDAITASGALFVEGGIMTNVAKERHRVPIFACGPGSGRLSSFANARLGMQIEDLGERLGQASAAKMFRSILVKGLEALFLECFAASGRFGVEDRVLEMVQLGYPGPDWRQWARSFIGRTARSRRKTCGRDD
ncbi:hypothetical protein LP421_34160 (plasmid) [Rhizobium sp. RCAM05350]|nr:hypothetical protein LP421_34160 [Rhizobium sp. RCAM05350]